MGLLKIARLPKEFNNSIHRDRRLLGELVLTSLARHRSPFQDSVFRSNKSRPNHLSSSSNFDTNRILARRKIKQRKNVLRRGTTAVEMAMIVPFILLVVLGSIEFSRIIMIKQSLTNSAREGCRFACLATSTDHEKVDEQVRYYLKRCFVNHQNQGKVVVTMTPSTLDQIESGTDITIQVSVEVSKTSWLQPRWTADAVIVGTSTMTRE